MIEREFADAQNPFPTILVCSESLHSRAKLREYYPQAWATNICIKIRGFQKQLYSLVHSDGYISVTQRKLMIQWLNIFMAMVYPTQND